jgi:hypothetical protein
MKTEIQEAMHGGAHQVSHHGLSFLDLVSADIATLYHAMNDDGQQQTLALGLLRLFLRWVELHGNHVTRLHYCPPLGLLWGFRHGDDSAASLVHQSYSQAVWRERGLLERLQLLAILLLAWPPLNLAMIGWATGINGASIRARTGKSIRRQLSEQLTLAGRHSIMPLYYYMFDLYDPEKYRQAGHYLQRLETKGGVFRILKDHLQTESPDAGQGRLRRAVPSPWRADGARHPRVRTRWREGRRRQRGPREKRRILAAHRSLRQAGPRPRRPGRRTLGL